MTKKATFLLIFLTFYYHSFSQEEHSYWDISIAKGNVIVHNSFLGNLAYTHPDLYQVSWGKRSDTTSVWKKKFNYPDQGITFTHQRFHNSILGNLTGVSYFTNLYLLNRNASHPLNLELGFGLAYTDAPMNLETNNQNTALSSHLNFSQYFKLNYRFPLQKNKFYLQSGLSFTHFSNSSYKNPNNGVNSVFLNMAFTSQNIKQFFTYPERLSFKHVKTNDSLHLNLKLGLGAHEIYPNLGTKSVYVLSIYAHKKIKPMAALQLGFDFFNSSSYKEYARFQYIAGFNDDQKIYDHKQLGIYTGFEQYFSRLSIEAQAGYYLYDPLKLNLPFYEKFGVKYHFKNSGFATGLNLKVHNFKADFASVNLEYQFF